MKELARCLALFGLVAGLTSPIYLYATSSSDPTKASGPSTIAADDLKFFEKAAQTGMAEVQAADIASNRGQGASVKSFAEAMTADHTANNRELKSLADKKGVTLPTQLDKKHQDLLAELQQLDPKKFDAEYAADMKKGHEDAVDLFEKTSKKSKDADIRQFASSTLPTLQHHLEMAKKLAEKS